MVPGGSRGACTTQFAERATRPQRTCRRRRRVEAEAMAAPTRSQQEELPPVAATPQAPWVGGGACGGDAAAGGDADGAAGAAVGAGAGAAVATAVAVAVGAGV